MPRENRSDALAPWLSVAMMRISVGARWSLGTRPENVDVAALNWIQDGSGLPLPCKAWYVK